jgi:hypothetical protein
MEIPIFPSNHTPYPPNEIHIEEVDIRPYPDRFRVHIHIRITPFMERPNLLLVARRDDNTIVSELNIIETMHFDMEFTLHIRNVKDPAGNYILDVELFYGTRNPPQDRRMKTFIVPQAVSP